MVKERASLEEIVLAFDEYTATKIAYDNCKAMLNDHLDNEMKELVHFELEELEQKLEELDGKLHILLLPRTRTTIMTLFWKSALERAATKHRCSARICCVCIFDMPSETVIKWNIFPTT